MKEHILNLITIFFVTGLRDDWDTKRIAWVSYHQAKSTVRYPPLATDYLSPSSGCGSLIEILSGLMETLATPRPAPPTAVRAKMPCGAFLPKQSSTRVATTKDSAIIDGFSVHDYLIEFDFQG
jgi:hypothetical protein